MSKIIRTETTIYCDFCRTESNSTVPMGWFYVTSIYAEKRMAFERNANPCEPQIWHACDKCGGKLYHWLKILGIDHTVVPAKGDFADGGRQFGSILVGVKEKGDVYDIGGQV